MKIQALEQYLTPKQKVFLLYFVFTFIFGTIQMYENGRNLIGLFCFMGFVMTGSLLFTRKALISNSNGLYLGLILQNIVIYKQKIDTAAYSQILIFENSAKQNIPWWTGLTSDMFINDDAYTFYLANNERKKKKYLMAFKQKEPMENGLRFLRNNSNLKLEFIENKKENHNIE